MIRTCIVTLILILGISIFYSYCPADDSEDQVVYAVSGKISAIDTFKSIITVKSLVTQPVISYSSVDIFIGPDTKITHKTNTFINSMFDLVMGNLVNVRCVYKGETLEALQITVMK